MIARIRADQADAKPLPRIRVPRQARNHLRQNGADEKRVGRDGKRSREGSILDCIRDQRLFASWFEEDWASWQPWLAFLAALFALPMDAEQLAIYRECTGRNDAPSAIAREAWLVCGRRAGKSFMLALTAVYLAAFHDYRPFLSPGEKGTIMIIAADRKQARVILRYVAALVKEVPILASLIQREWAEGFDLSNAVSIEVATCSFRSTRGYTLVAGLLDELAFWSTETSSEPDYEVLNALRPGMATIPRSMLLCASSPYARRGVLFEAHRKHFGKDGNVLVWQASTQRMNPTIEQSFIDAEVERDPASAQAEYFAQFRSDIEAFISREAVEACINAGTYERGRIEGVTYSAFCDPSGGSADSMTLAIASKQNGIATLDAIRERKPPFSPDEVVREFATVLKSYGISKVLGDRYAGEWVREPFKAHGITYEAGAKPKSDLYRDFLPLVNSKKVDLLDHPKLLQQLVGLERRTARSGKDSIDHIPGGHDDVCNAVAGAIVNVGVRKYNYDSSLAWVTGDADENEINERWRAGRLAQHLLTGGRGLFR
jgi:hypothetical protein